MYLILEVKKKTRRSYEQVTFFLPANEGLRGGEQVRGLDEFFGVLQVMAQAC